MAGRVLYTKKELGEIRKALLEERAQLERQRDEIATASFAANQSELSGEVSFDEEYADAGSSTFERERDLSLSNNIRDLIDKVEHALERMDSGAYGTCERCGKPIEKPRMKALPYATLCIRDKQAQERIR